MAALLERAEAKPTLGIMASNPHLLPPPHPSVQLPILSNVAMLPLSLYNGFCTWFKDSGGFVSDSDVDLFVVLDEK